MTDKNSFKPGKELTFKTIDSARRQLFQALSDDSAAEFCLDLSEVVACDSAGLALLIEAQRLCRKHNKAFHMSGTSKQVQSLAAFCGLDSLLKNIV